MAAHPRLADSKREEIDLEAERIIRERLARFDEDVKAAKPWPEPDQ
jgi:hypothetical protein